MSLEEMLIARLEQRLGAAFVGSTPVHMAQWQRMCAQLRAQVHAMDPGLRARASANAEAFVEEVSRCFFNATVTAGENVGITAAMAIGEKQTQLTLNSFHSAGIACGTVVNGVTRFGELMNASVSTKNAYMMLPLRVSYDTPHALREAIGDQLVAVPLNRIAKGVARVDAAARTVAFDLDVGAMYEYRVRPDRAAKRLQREFAPGEIHHVAWTWTHSVKELVVHVSDTVLQTGMEFLEAQAADTSDALAALVLEQAVVPSLRCALVAGTAGISELFINMADGDRGFGVQASGTNLGALLVATSPLAQIFDTGRVFTNNIGEVYKYLGIEATRLFLIKEFEQVVNADGTSVSRRHIELLVDAMTRNGVLTSVSRYGLRQKASVFARSSFEETVENLTRAASFAESDDMLAVSASIMAAKRVSVGTGHMDLLYDSMSHAASKAHYMQARLFDDALAI